MNKNVNNREYWNEYVAYWEKRVNETNDGSETNDITSSDNILVSNLEILDLKEKDVFLDFGCGNCRTLEEYKLFCNSINNYHGVDISDEALKRARSYHPELGDNALRLTDGKTIPFADNTFDKVFCYGVLDCCNQETTIPELLRVTKVGGCVYVTGKNYKYLDDDMLAYEAEIKARKNGFPNHFTRLETLQKQLLRQEVGILRTLYFLKRGDAARFEFSCKRKDSFYEWAMLLMKKNTNDIFLKDISEEYSYRFESVLKSNFL